MEEKKNPVPFCTCTDISCPLNPVNHDKGCTPCIAKNIRLGEIPTCFFKAIDREKPTDGWSVSDFARLVEAAEQDGIIGSEEKK